MKRQIGFARITIYRMMRPGEPPTEDSVEALFHRLSLIHTYDLSGVGRMRIQQRLGRDNSDGPVHNKRRYFGGH